MMRIIATLLVACLGCSSDAEHCDVNLRTLDKVAADYDAEICRGVGFVEECVASWGDPESMNDEMLETVIDDCIESIDVCYDDSASLSGLSYRSFAEIRGSENECVG